MSVSEPGSSAVWLLSAVVGARAAQPLAGPVRAFVGLDVAGLLNRPRFVLENVGVVHQPARFGARVSLGAEALFP